MEDHFTRLRCSPWTQPRLAATPGAVPGATPVDDGVLADWCLLIEGVEEEELSEIRACRALLGKILVRLLRLGAQEETAGEAQWSLELGWALAGLRRRCKAATRYRLDLDEIYDNAVYDVFGCARNFQPQGGVPEHCPILLEELLPSRAVGGALCDVTELAARFNASRPAVRFA